jgi:hypothetical protein
LSLDVDTALGQLFFHSLEINRFGRTRALTGVSARAPVQMGFIWGPYEIHMGSYGTILEVSRCVFLMGYMNFGVPECVDSEISRKISK